MGGAVKRRKAISCTEVMRSFDVKKMGKRIRFLSWQLADISRSHYISSFEKPFLSNLNQNNSNYSTKHHPPPNILLSLLLLFFTSLSSLK